MHKYRVASVFVVMIILVVGLLLHLTNKLDQLQRENTLLQQETVELKDTLAQEWDHIHTLQQTIYELNQLSERYEEERDAIQTKYAQLRKQLQRALLSSNCASEPLPVDVLDILRQYNSTTTITQP